MYELFDTLKVWKNRPHKTLFVLTSETLRKNKRRTKIMIDILINNFEKKTIYNAADELQ